MSRATIRAKSYLILTLLASLSISCSSYRCDYQWEDIDYRGFDSRDTISFTLSMEDSTALYDIYLCSRLSHDFPYKEQIPLYIEIVSPSGDRYSDRVSLPIVADLSNGVIDREWHYRDGIEPKEAGEWAFHILVGEGGIFNRGEIIKGLYGFGLYCKKNEFKE